MRGGLSSDMKIEKMFCSDKAKITNWGDAIEMSKRTRPFLHLGWDIEDTYYLKPIRVKRVIVSEELFDVYDVHTCASVGWETDNAYFSSSIDHSLLCIDSKFHTVEEIVEKQLWIQMARGNGHKVRIDSFVKRPEKSRIFNMEIEGDQNFLMNRVIHAA